MLSAGQLPRAAVLLFLAGLVANLLFALVPLPEATQMVGSTARNLGLIDVGIAILRPGSRQA